MAGDIVLINGVEELSIGATLADIDQPEALPMPAVDEPTLTMNFQVNTSPFAGKEGKFVTSRQLRERLEKELLTNVAMKLEETGDTDSFLVSGRGELHLTILLESMRREGYELAVSRPHVVIREIDGVKCEPFEMLTVDVEETHQGAVMEALGARRGDLQDMVSDERGRVRLDYRIPARGLDRLSIRLHDHDAWNRPHEPRIRRICADAAGNCGAPERRTDFRRAGRSRGLRAVEIAGARAHVRQSRGPSV